jgi:hypothetical protein
MRRVRRVLQTSSTKDAPPGLIDVHAGAGGGGPATGGPRAPPSLAYLSHYPYVDAVWNAEGLV